MVRHASGRRRTVRCCPAPHALRGDLAIQPYRPPRPRRLRPGSLCNRNRCAREAASLIVYTEPELFADETPDVFAELNRAFMSPVVIRVPAGKVVVNPIVVTHHIAGDGIAVFPRLVIDAGADSEVTVVERFVAADGADDDRALVVPVLQVHAAQAARVKYLAINEVGINTWQIGNQQAVGDRDSSTLLATVTLGGDYVRARTEARLSGKGGSTKQVALYFAGGTQMHDFRTIQDHDAPNTSSDLLFKGAVQDHASSVYTGLIKIRKHANGTTAFQTNRNLTLSEGAWAESVPNLDIETNDVKCSHASTVGPIDEDQRFYLESRGVRPEVAERLVVLGFFEEVISQLPAGSIADDLRVRVSNKLDLGSAVSRQAVPA
ncbi:MAG: Fe-S cluster assembly protein SufD [Acidimicrobiales bacterium]|nr:MAG: Fe-S cluster assembly protein SufD [Acidimicrobiales bacterium]